MKNNSFLLFYSFLFTILVTLISSSAVAQEHGIFELNNNQNTNKRSSDKSKYQSENNTFYDLAFNLHPTHYIKNNELKTTYDSGDPIKMTFEDSKSLAWLKNKNCKKNSLELLVINLTNINDLNENINILDDQDFMKLKYVFIICKFKCSENDIIKFIKGNTKVRIFYTNSVGG